MTYTVRFVSFDFDEIDNEYLVVVDGDDAETTPNRLRATLFASPEDADDAAATFIEDTMKDCDFVHGTSYIIEEAF